MAKPGVGSPPMCLLYNMYSMHMYTMYTCNAMLWYYCYNILLLQFNLVAIYFNAIPCMIGLPLQEEAKPWVESRGVGSAPTYCHCTTSLLIIAICHLLQYIATYAISDMTGFLACCNVLSLQKQNPCRLDGTTGGVVGDAAIGRTHETICNREDPRYYFQCGRTHDTIYIKEYPQYYLQYGGPTILFAKGDECPR